MALQVLPKFSGIVHEFGPLQVFLELLQQLVLVDVVFRFQIGVIQPLVHGRGVIVYLQHGDCCKINVNREMYAIIVNKGQVGKSRAYVVIAVNYVSENQDVDAYEFEIEAPRARLDGAEISVKSLVEIPHFFEKLHHASPPEKRGVQQRENTIRSQ